MSDNNADDDYQPPLVLLSGDLSRLDRRALADLSAEQKYARIVLYRYVRDVLAAAEARGESWLTHPEWTSWQYLKDLIELLVDNADADSRVD
jgi:hypothetical protein